MVGGAGVSGKKTKPWDDLYIVVRAICLCLEEGRGWWWSAGGDRHDIITATIKLPALGNTWKEGTGKKRQGEGSRTRRETAGRG